MLRVDRTKPRKTRCFVQYLEDAVEEWIDFATHSFRDLQISAAGIAAKSGADVAAAIEAAKRKRGRRDDRRRGPAASPSKRDLLGATDHTAATEAATIPCTQMPLVVPSAGLTYAPALQSAKVE